MRKLINNYVLSVIQNNKNLGILAVKEPAPRLAKAPAFAYNLRYYYYATEVQTR